MCVVTALPSTGKKVTCKFIQNIGSYNGKVYTAIYVITSIEI